MDYRPHNYESHTQHEKHTEYKMQYIAKQPVHDAHESQRMAEYILECVIQNCSLRLNTDAFQYLLNRRELTNTQQNDHGYKLRVMSYNILADSLTTHTTLDFQPFDLKYVDWNHRSKSILKEITFYSPDILCLQEVDRNDKLLMPSLQEDYAYTTKMRTGNKNDGLGIAWKKSKFDLIENKYIEFNLDGEAHPLLDRDNVAIFAVLQIKSQELSLNDRIVIVANIHVLFNEKRGDIKVTQIYLALKIIKALCIKYEKYSKMIFLGGDFNSIPNSALYQWLSGGNFNFSDIRTNLISGQGKAFWSNQKYFPSFKDYLTANINYFKYDDRLRENRLDPLEAWMTMLRQLKVRLDADDRVKIVIAHYQEGAPQRRDRHKFDFSLPTPIHLKSSYGSFQRYYYKNTANHLPPPTIFKNYSTFESLCTTFSINGASTVDYIWYAEFPPSNHPRLYHKLRAVKVFEPPLTEDLALLGRRFPQKFFPSDHFSLIVDFMFDL